MLSNDYPFHAQIAQQWIDTRQPRVPHFLYEVLSIVVRTIVPAVFGVGAFYPYFFVEGGSGTLEGNFAWLGQIPLYIVFIMSLLFSLEHGGLRTLTRRSVVRAGVFGLHVLSGVVWAWRHASSQANLWW